MSEAEEQELVKASTLSGCMACRSSRLRPLILLAREGKPPGSPDHNIVYSHDAMFACEDCHCGYAEVRRHDCFDFEEVFDQDEHHALDADGVARLRECLAHCPAPLSEQCTCDIHQSLRKSWSSLPRGLWDQYNPDFPRPLLQMADPDQDRWFIPRISVEVSGNLPKLRLYNGRWSAHYKNGNLKAKGELENGRMNGEWTFWYPNGQKKAEGKYARDQREGKWTEWNEAGKKTSEQTFKAGRAVST
jgi:hypothetical protein